MYVKIELRCSNEHPCPKKSAAALMPTCVRKLLFLCTIFSHSSMAQGSWIKAIHWHASLFRLQGFSLLPCAFLWRLQCFAVGIVLCLQNSTSPPALKGG